MRTLIQTIAGVVFGAGIILALAMLFLAAWPPQVRAATAPNQGACHTPTEVRLTYEAHIPGLTTSVYRGADAAAFLKALSEDIGPPPDDLRLVQRTVAIGAYTSGAFIEIDFYENIAGMECGFTGLSGDSRDLGTVMELVKAMAGTGA